MKMITSMLVAFELTKNYFELARVRQNIQIIFCVGVDVATRRLASSGKEFEL